jgi:Tfp pilus assembly protein PilV
MKRSIPSNKSGGTLRAGQQRGDALLEALIGVLLTSVIGLGLAFSAARIQKSQHYQTTQNVMLASMINSMSTNGIACGTSNATLTIIGSTNATSSTTCTQPAISVSTGTDSRLSITLAANSAVTAMTYSAQDASGTFIGGGGSMTLSL